jgi:surface antigen
MKPLFLILFVLFTLTACGRGAFNTHNASGYSADDNEQCVPFARRESGIQLFGNADSWWWKAEPNYRRGSTPQEGAVLVLKATPKLKHGHVAVVKDIRNERQIMVTHSNWGNSEERRRIVYESMLVQDVSPYNNWSSVRFWNKEANSLGLPYSTYGFIYAERLTPYQPASKKGGFFGFLPDWF